MSDGDDDEEQRAAVIQATWRAYAARRKLVGEEPRAAPMMSRWLQRYGPIRFDAARVMRTRVLGRGAYGTVWLGVHLSSGEQLAVKDIVFDTSRGGLSAVQREFELLCLLAHPNIVQIRGFALAGDTASIFLEYVPGGSLHQLLYRGDRRLHEELIRGYARQTLEGLRYLHARDVLHRDVKPHNLLVGVDGTVKLSDFGCCKTVRESSTATQHLVGTPAYMAPEVITGRATRGGDVWAAACAFVELATRRMPWFHVAQARNNVALIFQIGTGAGREGHHPLIPPHLSAACSEFLRRCFRPDTADRPSCEELKRDVWLREQGPPDMEDLPTYRARTDREAADGDTEAGSVGDSRGSGSGSISGSGSVTTGSTQAVRPPLFGMPYGFWAPPVPPAPPPAAEGSPPPRSHAREHSPAGGGAGGAARPASPHRRAPAAPPE